MRVRKRLRARKSGVEQGCDRRKRRSAGPGGLRPIGISLTKNNNRLGLRVKSSLVYSDGRIATDTASSLMPLISSTNGSAEISYFMVLRMPSKSVAPLK